MKNEPRSLKIRKKQHSAPIEEQITLLKAIVREELKPLKDQVAILRFNSHCAGVVLRDMGRCATLSAALSGSTKVKLDEYFQNIEKATENMGRYLEVDTEDLERLSISGEVDLGAFDEQDFANYEEAEFEAGRHPPELQDETDCIIENVSGDDSWE